MNTQMFGLAAANTAAPETPIRPPAMAVRRCRRSTTEPSRGEAPMTSSVIMSARPSRERLTPKSSLILAKNGGAKRKQAFAARRAVVSGNTCRRVSTE